MLGFYHRQVGRDEIMDEYRQITDVGYRQRQVGKILLTSA